MSRLLTAVAALLVVCLSTSTEAVPTLCPATVNYPAGSLCLNVTNVPLDQLNPSTNTARININLVGYDGAVAAPNHEWVSIVLSEGCQINNPRFRAQWGNSSIRNNIAVLFVDPRGSGHSSRVMCPDDPTGQNMIPSAACAAYVTQQNLNQFYTMEQLAYDLQLNILPAVTQMYPTPLVHLVAGDTFGNTWIQAWQKYFPDNTAPGMPVSFIQFNSPPALETYDFFQALVENPDSNVRTVLAQCSASPQCAAMFGGSDLNQLLSEVMRSARQNELSCNAALIAAWDTPTMGPVPTPIFRFYSELLGMLLKSPQDAFADWNDQLPGLIPGVLYRIQRCNANDVTVISGLYAALRAYATATNTPNPRGTVVDWSQCYVSPIVRWNLVFNDLLANAPPTSATLIGSENDNVVIPSPTYVTAVKQLYNSWPKNPQPAPPPGATSKWGTYATGIIPFNFIIGAVNPIVRPQMSMFAAGADYSMPGAAPVSPGFGTGMIFQPVVIPTGNQFSLYSSPEFNGGFQMSCSLALLWTFNANRTLPYCVATLGAMPTFDFTGVNPVTLPMRQQFLSSGAGPASDPFQSTGVLALPVTYPPEKLQFQTTTPLPPGQTPDPPTTPLPAGHTYAPTTPEPFQYSESESEHYSETGEHITATIHISVAGLVVAILVSVAFVVLLVVCVAKVVQRRMNDPTKRDFYAEVYGAGKSGAINNNQQDNVYRNV